jgi:uncharacterized protein (DUF2384 family)
MGTAAEGAALNRRPHAGRTRGRAAVSDPGAFWLVQIKRQNAGVNEWRLAFDELVGRVISSPGLTLFKALEAGVPTYAVNVIARATGEPVKDVLDMIGVSQSTFRRKQEAGLPLPDVAGQRVMSFLRVAATLRRMLEESGDPQLVKQLDLAGWLAQWMREQLAVLGGKTPAQMLRNFEGQLAVEQVLERMRGGLPA